MELAVVHPRVERRSASTGHTLLLVVACTALTYAAIVLLTIRPYGYNASSLIGAWSHLVAANPAEMGHHVVVFRNSGYDGFTYYLVADDPVLGQSRFHDAFRSQRVGYPLAVAVVSLGQRDWRPAAMLAVNLAAVLAVAFFSGLIILKMGEGVSVWWAYICALNPGLIIGVQRDLSEPLTMALAVLGLWLYLRQRTLWAGLALAGALLTREVAILFIAPLVIGELIARHYRRAVALALPVVPYLLWQAILAHILGTPFLGGSEGQLSGRLSGIRAVLTAALHASAGHKVGWASVIAVIVVVGIALLVSALMLVRRYDVFTAEVFAHAGTAVFGAPSIWLGFASAARVFGGIYPLTILAYARFRTRPLALLAGLIVALSLFTLVRFVLLNPPEAYYLTP